MDSNTTLVLIITALCSLWAIQAIARAWTNRPQCNCTHPPQDETERVDLNK